ncbi:unnamed protein product [Cercospora beticola]|nr:unnamed protein product [Cercospora beticola]
MVEILKFWGPASMDESPPPDNYTILLHRMFPSAAFVNRAFYAAARAQLPPLLTFTPGKRYVLPPPGTKAMEAPEGPDDSISATLEKSFHVSPQELQKIRRFAIRWAKYTVRNEYNPPQFRQSFYSFRGHFEALAKILHPKCIVEVHEVAEQWHKDFFLKAIDDSDTPGPDFGHCTSDVVPEDSDDDASYSDDELLEKICSTTKFIRTTRRIDRTIAVKELETGDWRADSAATLPHSSHLPIGTSGSRTERDSSVGEQPSPHRRDGYH